MKFVKPLVFNLASTKVNYAEMQGYLGAVGAPDWETNAPSDGELLIEVAGKSCYKSFSVNLNANLSRVRTMDNASSIKNLAAQEHGSVFEHVHETFAMLGVTRVLTHETVRHRIANYSQESLRFVRLTDLSARFPTVFQTPFLDQVKAHLEAKGIKFLT